ncbi:ABC transporter substrate-binding protein [Rhodoligotrophos defluvii]|uniref:ABC transporter substrate-binding protein n=1 Tax=Rhodoligotrophos defluvii TaxID=2561934 RepID=UPI001EF03B4A|nr:ABC transporter substrate-binding protein [Rhodoligotrophos defluvii]
MVKIGLAQDFTAVYTFVTSDYNQGQRDYFTLINERGGIDGYTLQVDVVDTANQPQRGIEAYERMKNDGVVLVDFLSTPVSRAVVPRALKDQVNMMTIMHGRSDAADGETFPFIFPMSPLYWSQAASIVKYIADQENGDLKGKKIAFVGIDSPFGREPLPIFQALADKEGFELSIFHYPSPGNEQSATWTSVRRVRPDWTIIWGAGVGQTVSLREAIRNGIKLDRLVSNAWLSEVDTEIAGREAAKGVLRFEGVAYGKDLPIIQAIENEVVAKGKSAGPAEKVGSSYYNIGVAGAALVVEGIRHALEKAPGKLAGPQLKAGLESIANFDAQGLMPPVTISARDHQGGGKGRICQWDGTRWVPKTDWYAASQDLVWELVRKTAQEFKASGN